jgi:hypothetical protein
MKLITQSTRSCAALAATLLIAGLPLLAACGDTPAGPTPTAASSQPPQDFSVVYEWREGSLPPPYHYEYTVKVGPGTEGTMALRPDYPSDNVPTWTESFAVTGEQMQQLYKTVVDEKLLRDPWPQSDDISVGGSTQWAVITSGDKQAQTPIEPLVGDRAMLNAFYDQVKSLVPKATWDKLMAQREEYKNAREP